MCERVKGIRTRAHVQCMCVESLRVCACVFGGGRSREGEDGVMCKECGFM